MDKRILTTELDEGPDPGVGFAISAQAQQTADG